MADGIRRIVIRIHLHIVITIRVWTFDGCAWWLWRWPVWTVQTTYIRYAWLVTTNVFNVVIGGHHKLDEGTATPVVLAEDLRELDSSVSLDLVIPVSLRTIGVPPPDKCVATL